MNCDRVSWRRFPTRNAAELKVYEYMLEHLNVHQQRIWPNTWIYIFLRLFDHKAHTPSHRVRQIILRDRLLYRALFAPIWYKLRARVKAFVKWEEGKSPFVLVVINCIICDNGKCARSRCHRRISLVGGPSFTKPFLGGCWICMFSQRQAKQVERRAHIIEHCI